MVEAFRSVESIIEYVDVGWLVRSTHRWSSGIMFQMIVLHVSRVYFTGGLQKAQGGNLDLWGVLSYYFTISFGTTGYCLPWDQVGFWACKIVAATPEATDTLVPGLGSLLVVGLRSGYSVTQFTLSRLYNLHTLILPILAIFFASNAFPTSTQAGVYQVLCRNREAFSY